MINSPNKKLCSHHIFCAGDRTIPYARLSAMCIYWYCPEYLRANLKIYIHLDGLSVDVNETAEWLTQVPCTETTIGLFGIKANETVSGKFHQAMINTIAKLFSHESVIAFIDADCFLIDHSWHEATFEHDPSLDYSHIPGFKGETIAVYQNRQYRKMRTTLFTLTPSLHNSICEQKFNQDRSAYEKLPKEFPDVHFETIKQMDTMVSSSLKAQLLGYQIKSLGRAIRFIHVGGFSYMPSKKLQQFKTRLERLDMWLNRLRLNTRVLEFFYQLGWENRVSPSYAFRIEEMMKLTQSDSFLVERISTLPKSSPEKKFQQILEPLGHEFALIK